jgi:serine kinase of HPr protein (carbohydrate metabolism regulator)
VTRLEPLQIHATCVASRDGAVVLRGASGAGKSDLGFRLIDRGFHLVADDRVDLRRVGSRLVATAPATLRGLIELRGIGIVRIAAVRDEADVALVVDLVPRVAVERLPEPASAAYLGVAVPRLALDPFDAATPAKLAFVLATPDALRRPADALRGKPAA